jgi:hypothetical protein
MYIPLYKYITMFNAILIILVIFSIYIYSLKLTHPKYKIVTFADIQDKVKTGDMILFVSLDTVNQLFMGSYYTHLGIVYRDGDSAPTLVESFNPHRMDFYPKEFSSGIAVCDLETRINTYRGFVLYKELAKPVSHNNISDFEEFILYATKNMKYDKDVIFGEIGKILFNTPFSNETNCGQFTALILMKLGLLDFSNFNNRQKHHLRWTSNIKKLKNNHYKEPVYVYSEYFKVPKL